MNPKPDSETLSRWRRLRALALVELAILIAMTAGALAILKHMIR